MTFEEFRDKWGSMIHDRPEMIWAGGFEECKRRAVEIANSEYDPGGIAEELEKMEP